MCANCQQFCTIFPEDANTNMRNFFISIKKTKKLTETTRVGTNIISVNASDSELAVSFFVFL
jgi:hypothetical protein